MNTGLGGWMGISRHLAKHLPKDRPYTELEAMYSLQLDYWENNDASVAGYAGMWQWGRERVRTFLSKVSAEISKGDNQYSLGKISPRHPTGSSTGTRQAPDRHPTGSSTGTRQARLINIKCLDDQTVQAPDRHPTGTRQAAVQAPDRQQYTTIEKEKETERETDITTTPQPPAGGSEAGEEREGGDDQPPAPPLPTAADPPEQAEQTGKPKRVKLVDEGVVFFRSLRPDWVTETQWEEIICWRIRKKTAMTQRAANTLIGEMLKSRNRGYTVDQILDLLSKKPWSSYEDRYLDDQQMQPAAPRQPVQQGGAAPRPMPNSRELAERRAQERYDADMRRNQPENEQEGG